MSEKTKVINESDVKLETPKMYAVIIHNDEYTTMDFVVEVIVKVFHKTSVEATQIMFSVHEKGRGVVGVYTHDIAVTKKIQTEQIAKLKGFPLKLTVEQTDL